MIVVVAEKPSVAREIAKVLGARQKQTGYLSGNGYIVSWALGHLIELQEPQSYDKALKNWSLAQLPFIPPSFRLRIKKGATSQFSILKELMKSASELICATDAGREGELIFRYIQQKAEVLTKPTKRLWISSLTQQAIKEGFAHLQPQSAYNALADAARCRSEADWIVGLNATRAYTVQYSHGQGVLSIGRVQTPVLAMIVERHHTINNFVSESFYQVKTEYRKTTFLHQNKRFCSREKANRVFVKIQGYPLTITQITQKEVAQKAPLLFDLTELQKLMNKGFGFSASRTLSAAQQLYEKKLITYPRTDSKFLSDDIFPSCDMILNKLSTQFPEVSHIIKPLQKNRRYFNSAKVSDHHAIIPTGVLSPKLQGDLQTLFTVICKRFIAIFLPHAIEEQSTVEALCNQEPFITKGKRLLTPGWKTLYPQILQSKADEEPMLPSFEVNESGPHTPHLHEGWTTPPPPFTEATLLGAMETAGKEVDNEELQEILKEKGLGTPATRAATIETLLKRDYIVKKRKELLPTEKGIQLIALLQDQPVLISPELTGQWEYKLREIEKSRYSRGEFMEAISTFTQTLITRLHKSDKEQILGLCPLCGSSVIKGTRGGYGCSAWKSGCPFRFHGIQFGVSLTEQHVSQILARGRTTRSRQLTTASGEIVKGYISLDKKSGNLSITTTQEKLQTDAIGTCPLCRSAVVENYKSYNCSSCNFTIWKTVAGKKVATKLAQVLLSKGKTMKLNGFRSKKGKRFAAALILKEGKVELQF